MSTTRQTSIGHHAFFTLRTLLYGKDNFNFIFKCEKRNRNQALRFIKH